MRDAFLLSVALCFALTCGACGACEGGYLRGSATPSRDGKTYLIVADDKGGHCGPIRLDGKPWPHPVGQAGRVEPGVHTLQCGSELSFDVPAGKVFTFDYWGP